MTLVTDSVGRMFGGAKTAEATWSEDMKVEHFKQLYGDVPDWVEGFFAFVKASYDNNTCSFMFVTSKPMHLVIELPQIKHYMIGNVIKCDLESETYSYLALDLNDKDVKTYLTQVVPSSMVDSVFDALQDKEQTGEAERRRIGHLAAMTKGLFKIKEWQDQLKAEKAKTPVT